MVSRDATRDGRVAPSAPIVVATAIQIPTPNQEKTGRSAQIFLVEVIVRIGGQTRRVAVKGQDIYAFSAPLVCEAVCRILDGSAQAPGADFDARGFLDALARSMETTEAATD